MLGSPVGPVLSTSQLLQVGKLLEEHLSMELDDITDLFDIDDGQHSQLVQQLLIYFPVMTLQGSKCTVIVNLHELIDHATRLTDQLHWNTNPVIATVTKAIVSATAFSHILLPYTEETWWWSSFTVSEVSKRDRSSGRVHQAAWLSGTSTSPHRNSNIMWGHSLRNSAALYEKILN